MCNPEKIPTKSRYTAFRILQQLAIQAMIALLLQSSLSSSALATPAPGRKNVIILYGASTKLPAHALFNSGLLPLMKTAGVDDSDLHQEYLDLQHSAGSEYRNCLAEYLRTKYAGEQFDVIIAFQPDALDFMLNEGSELFPGTPIVAAVTKEMIGGKSAGRKVIQLVYGFDALSTLNIAMTLLPDTKEVLVIAGPSTYDRHHLESALEAAEKLDGKVAFRFLTNHQLPEILKEVSRKREHAVILYTRLSSDSSGKVYIPRTVLTEISRAAKSPVFGLHDSLLGSGIVGGNLLSFAEIGKEVASISINLATARDDTQPLKVRFNKHTPMFDWAEMQRWGLGRSGLPNESVLINYRPGFWEQYWRYAIITLIFIAGESLLIAYLVWNRHLRIRSEKELHKSEELLKSYLHSSAVISWMKDEYGRYVFLSDTYQKRFGVRFEEWEGKTDYEVWPSDAAESYRRHDQEVLAEGRAIELIEMVTESNGNVSWWLITKFLFQDAGGMRFIGGLGVDITDLKQAEAALLKSALYARSLIEASLDPLVTISQDGKIMDVNQATVEATGVPREMLIGTVFSDYFTDPASARLGYETVLRDGIVRDYPLSIRHVSGRITDVLYNAAVYRDSEGELLGIFAAARDVTKLRHAEQERLELERQLLDAQKLESLGVLAGGIAHDFNNILTSIIGNTDLALLKLDQESPVRNNLKRIATSAHRAADIAKQMLAYSGKGRFIIGSVNLNRLIEALAHLIEASISKKNELHFNLTKPLPSVTADESQISQVLMNLVINASEAIGDRCGTITISTGCKNCDRDYLRGAWLSNDIAEGLYVYLEVEDTGCGMDKETQAKIFDPFFTTKFTGRGLGMAAVQGIIRGHKGSIQIYSEPEKGSIFRVLLPAGETGVKDMLPGLQESDFQGHGTVLLVDDEDFIREIGKEMLQALGFSVISASDGNEALEAFRANQDISCVILDYTMPHMDGLQCFNELRMLDPNIKVVMSSGYSEQDITSKLHGQLLTGFIQKPFTISSLREVLMNLEELRNPAD